MKKLMLGLVVAAFAVTTQATTCKWAFLTATSASLDGVTQAKADLLVYQFASVNDANAAKTAMEAALRADSSYDLTKATGYETTLQLGNDGKLAQVQGLSWDSSDTANNYFIAVLTGADKEGNEYVYMSAPATKKGNAGVEQAVTLAIGATTMNGLTVSGTAPGWYQYTSVPEPTSGLLLLLGVAGLALKRRRA